MNVTNFPKAPALDQTPPPDRPEYAEDKPPEIRDTDLANSRRLAARHGPDLHFTTEGGWLVWDGQRFASDEKAVRLQALAKDTVLAIFDEISQAPTKAEQNQIISHARRSQSKSAIQAMEYLARSEPGIYVALTSFDADPMLLNVVNGTLDLRTGELREHSRTDCITKLAPVPFDADATCGLWDAFLWRVTGGREDLCAYLRRLTGYLLTGLTTEQVIVFLFGLGANGKSVFCEVLTALMGDYAMAALPELVMARRHAGIPNDVAALRGRRVALMNETTQGSRFDEAKLKHLTGGDTLSGRFLHREFFDFAPTHKLVIRGNHKPAIAGTDEGIWRRLHLVPFEVQIPPAEQDRNLLTRLRAELPGILRWAVQGCLEWQESGLQPPAIITDAVREYREESDVLGKFIAERCEINRLAEVKSGAFFSAYQAYCERAAERWMPHKDLPAEMRRRGFEHRRTKAGGMYLGVSLATANEPDWRNG